VGVTKVEFWVQGARKCTDTATPYTCTWKTPGQSGTASTLQAKAYDAAGNISTSASVTVTTH
jgi:hypothetical protein